MRFIVALLLTLALAASVRAFSGPGELVAAPANLTFAGPMLDETKAFYVMVLFSPSGTTTAQMTVADAVKGYSVSGTVDVDRVRVVMRNALIEEYRKRMDRSRATTINLRT